MSTQDWTSDCSFQLHESTSSKGRRLTENIFNFDFSPLCVFKCVLKSSEKNFWQITLSFVKVLSSCHHESKLFQGFSSSWTIIVQWTFYLGIVCSPHKTEHLKDRLVNVATMNQILLMEEDWLKTKWKFLPDQRFDALSKIVANNFKLVQFVSPPWNTIGQSISFGRMTKYIHIKHHVFIGRRLLLLSAKQAISWSFYVGTTYQDREFIVNEKK